MRILGKFGSAVLIGLVMFSAQSCSTEKTKNKAKETAARYWQEKAYPGKSFNVQVTDAEKDENGGWRVKGIVDGESRVGNFNPDTESFSEGYYSLSHEREKHIAELEQQVKYLTDKVDGLEKENYKLKVNLNLARGNKPDAPIDTTK